MKLLNQTRHANTYQLICILILCLCLLVTGLAAVFVQASGLSAASYKAGNTLTPSGQDEPESVSPSEADGVRGNDITGEDETPASDRPGQSDSHNSTGDDVVIRIRR